MEVRAIGRYKRISPQKVRLIIGQVKGRLIETGLNSLSFMPQKAAGIVEKIVRSAVANAEEKGLDVDDLYIKNIYVDQGPMLKRFRPRARGRATRILKKTSHITVILAEKAA